MIDNSVTTYLLFCFVSFLSSPTPRRVRPRSINMHLGRGGAHAHAYASAAQRRTPLNPQRVIITQHRSASILYAAIIVPANGVHSGFRGSM